MGGRMIELNRRINGGGSRAIARVNSAEMWPLIFGGHFIRPIDDQDIKRRLRRVQTQTELLLKPADQRQS